MSIPILLRNESIKMTRFLPFRVAVLAFTALMLLTNLQSHFRPPRPGAPAYALPLAWNSILGDTLMAGAMFLSVLLVLLIANEFTWRTARQNVIDGLSKEEWFLGKLLVVLMIVALFFMLVVPLGGAIAMLGHDPATTQPLIRGADARLMGAFALCLAGHGALALFISTTVRSPGSAIGLFFLYIGIVEQLLAFAVRRAGERTAFLADYLPGALFRELLSRNQWDADAWATTLQQLAAAGRPAPTLMDNTMLLSVSVGWIVLLVACAFLIFRRRDL
jgi:ABC-type transport system involved in multi-copper enzyme maturation permease subunit